MKHDHLCDKLNFSKNSSREKLEVESIHINKSK